MNKINNKKIILGLGILAVFAFGLILPAEVNADIAGYVTPYNSTSFNSNVVSNNQYNTYQGAYTYTPPAPIVYNPVVYTTPTPTVYSSTVNTSAAAPKTVAKAKTTPKKDDTETKTDSNLTASAVSGSKGFIPSGIIQWIVFAILVLLAVILARRIYATQKYQAAPLKHD